MTLRFSKANCKLARMYDLPALAEWLTGDRRIYSFDLLAGHTCPGASICLAKVLEDKSGRLSLWTGPRTEVTCFAASGALRRNVYNRHKSNTAAVRGRTTDTILGMLRTALPQDAGIVRVHVSGDFYSLAYLRAWIGLCVNVRTCCSTRIASLSRFWRKSRARFLLTSGLPLALEVVTIR